MTSTHCFKMSIDTVLDMSCFVIGTFEIIRVISMLVSLVGPLGEVLFMICTGLGSIIAYDTIQISYIICDVPLCSSILRAFSSLWRSH